MTRSGASRTVQTLRSATSSRNPPGSGRAGGEWTKDPVRRRGGDHALRDLCAAAGEGTGQTLSNPEFAHVEPLAPSRCRASFDTRQCPAPEVLEWLGTPCRPARAARAPSSGAVFESRNRTSGGTTHRRRRSRISQPANELDRLDVPDTVSTIWSAVSVARQSTPKPDRLSSSRCWVADPRIVSGCRYEGRLDRTRASASERRPHRHLRHPVAPAIAQTHPGSRKKKRDRQSEADCPDHVQNGSTSRTRGRQASSISSMSSAVRDNGAIRQRRTRSRASLRIRPSLCRRIPRVAGPRLRRLPRGETAEWCEANRRNYD